MAWRAELQLDYTLETQRTVARHSHQGPLRILKSLYPEGDGICHNVLVHPPGGLVGGDTIDIQISVASGAHGLVSTPGATRFYKSGGHPALQQVIAHVADQARLEWLPLEAIAYNECEGTNRAVFNLEPGAELITWDVTWSFSTALGNSGRLAGTWQHSRDRRKMAQQPTWLGGSKMFGQLGLCVWLTHCH
jgi:urease accessory protein